MRVTDLLCHMREEKGRGSISVAMARKAGGVVIFAEAIGKKEK